MKKYLKHLIYHLRKYGNVYFPSNRIAEFGAKEILAALRYQGYDCSIRYFPDALLEEKTSILTSRNVNKDSLDAVLTLKGRTR